MADRYIATQPLYSTGPGGRPARAANPGDTIPQTHPQFAQWKKDGLVAREDTKAAQATEAEVAPKK